MGMDDQIFQKDVITPELHSDSQTELDCVFTLHPLKKLHDVLP